MANNWKYWDSNGNPQTWGVGASLPAGADLFRAEFLNQFIRAANERYAALGLPTELSEFSAGDDVQSVESVSRIQAIYAVTPDFTYLRDWDGATWAARSGFEVVLGGLTYKDYGGTDDQGFENLLQEAGLLGIRYSMDGVNFSYKTTTTGYFTERGHVIGPWIFEDLQLVLHYCTRTAHAPDPQGAEGESTTSGYQVSCDLALSTARANFTPYTGYMIEALQCAAYVKTLGTPPYQWIFSGTKYALTVASAGVPSGVPRKSIAILQEDADPVPEGFYYDLQGDDHLHVISSGTSDFVPEWETDSLDCFDVFSVACPITDASYSVRLYLVVVADWSGVFEFN